MMCFRVSGALAEDKQSPSQPSWIVSLKKYDYRAPHRGLVNDPGSLGDIAFSKSTVAVIFDEKSEENQNSGTNTKIWYGWRLSVVFLNAATGALVAKHSWIGKLDWHRRLIPTADGNFVLLLTKFPKPVEIPLTESGRLTLSSADPATIFLLSSSGDELKRIDLKHGNGWQILASPLGTSVLLCGRYNGSLEFHLLDADTLEERTAWSEADVPKLEPLAVSDEYVLFRAGKEYLIERFDGESRKIPLPLGNPQFLSGDAILTVTPPTMSPSGGRVTITSITGKEIAAIDLGIRDRLEGAIAPVAAADGQRFGTIVDQIGGRFLQKYQRTARIWQRPGNDVVLKTDIPYSERPEAALSSTGSALAILNGGKIAMYCLPTPNNITTTSAESSQ